MYIFDLQTLMKNQWQSVVLIRIEFIHKKFTYFVLKLCVHLHLNALTQYGIIYE